MTPSKHGQESARIFRIAIGVQYHDNRLELHGRCWRVRREAISSLAAIQPIGATPSWESIALQRALAIRPDSGHHSSCATELFASSVRKAMLKPCKGWRHHPAGKPTLSF